MTPLSRAMVKLMTDSDGVAPFVVVSAGVLVVSVPLSVACALTASAVRANSATTKSIVK